MEALLDRLSALPLWALYGTMSVIAAIENIFPPVPADTVVAIGSFLAARGKGLATVAFVATWIGNVAGAMVMYGAGRRYGVGFLDKFLRRVPTADRQESRLETLYLRYGLVALAVSRLLPGIRALVPPFAGAIRLPAPSVLAVIALPSGLWYGLVTLVAFQMGSNLNIALDSIRSTQKWTTIAAAVVVTGLAMAWLVMRRRKAE